MKLFTCDNFQGHYSIGVAAVVLAPTERQAKHLLLAQLEAEGLPQDAGWEPELVQIPQTRAQAIIICSGNY